MLDETMRRRCQDCNGTVVRAWHRAIALLALAACAKEARPVTRPTRRRTRTAGAVMRWHAVGRAPRKSSGTSGRRTAADFGDPPGPSKSRLRPPGPLNGRAGRGFEVNSDAIIDRPARNARCPPSHRDPRR